MKASSLIAGVDPVTMQTLPCSRLQGRLGFQPFNLLVVINTGQLIMVFHLQLCWACGKEEIQGSNQQQHHRYHHHIHPIIFIERLIATLKMLFSFGIASVGLCMMPFHSLLQCRRIFSHGISWCPHTIASKMEEMKSWHSSIKCNKRQQSQTSSYWLVLFLHVQHKETYVQVCFGHRPRVAAIVLSRTWVCGNSSD